MDGVTYTYRPYDRRPFDAAGCTQCGLCFSECPVLRLPEEQAKAAIAALPAYLEDDGARCDVAERVLSGCTSCFACNLVCPEDCRPANLVLDIWRRQYRQEGLPERARYFLPHSVPNFRTYVIDRFSPEEKAAIARWKRLDPAEEIFYPGCNLITTPYLTFSRLFDGLDIRGALEYCCGEMYFRMGLYDQLEEVARKNTAYFERLGVRRVNMLCTAGLNLFTHVLPQFGADFDGIEFVPYLKTLYEKLRSGELPIVHRFDGKTITVQDSCHAKLLEPGFDAWPRKILTLLGYEIREATHHANHAVCCGIGAGFSHDAAYRRSALIRGQRTCMKNATRPGTHAVAVYCSGCLAMLSVAKYVSWTTTPVYHILEVIQQAIGETPPRKQGALAFDFLKGTLLHQKGGKKRFFVPPIE